MVTLSRKLVAEFLGTLALVFCGPGTAVVVDTSAIHRARPCIEGTRYALTAYFR